MKNDRIVEEGGRLFRVVVPRSPGGYPGGKVHIPLTQEQEEKYRSSQAQNPRSQAKGGRRQ